MSLSATLEMINIYQCVYLLYSTVSKNISNKFDTKKGHNDKPKDDYDSLPDSITLHKSVHDGRDPRSPQD